MNGSLVVTGTGTGVGKTVVTGGIAALAREAGRRVAVVKPVQTGVVAGQDADLADVTRLSGVTDVHELDRFPDPLAPEAAARRAGRSAPHAAEIANRIRALSDRELVILEGAGGLLVRLNSAGDTVCDVAAMLEAPVVVVVRAGLGTLSATALTCNELRRRGLRCLGVVIGSWPAEPDLAARENLSDLPVYAGGPLLGSLPEGAGQLDPTAFLALARAHLSPVLGGRWT